MRIGILTGGGDCLGLNAVIRAVVRKGIGEYGDEVVGSGTAGAESSRATRWRWTSRRSAASCPGAARCSAPPAPIPTPSKVVPTGVRATLERLGIDAPIPIVGEDTLGVATKLSEAGLKVVGVPKTIDNDLDSTDYTFGFDTAVGVAMEAIDRLHTTAAATAPSSSRGRGLARGLDRAARGAGRRRQRHPDPGEPLRRRRRRGAPPAPLRSPATRRSSSSPRGPSRRTWRAHAHDRGEGRVRHVRLAASSGARVGDRGAAPAGRRGRGARAHPAGWHAVALRPGAGHAVGLAADATHDGEVGCRALMAPTSSGCPQRGDGAAQAGAGRPVRRGRGLLRLEVVSATPECLDRATTLRT